MKWNFPSDTVYQVMHEQPDWCFQCGSRLEFIEMAKIDGEDVYICECPACQRVIPVVEDDMEPLED